MSDAAAEQKEKELQKEPEEHYGEDSYTEEQLRAAWEAFANKAKASGRSSEYAILKQDIRLAENDTIIITFTNSVKMILDGLKSDIITHLKSTLNNRNLKLETELIEEDDSKIPYTNREKFDYLAEKKPILNELKNRLGLDTDF
ncbi:MAG TPA: hypothetical protein PKL31_07185 [Fulvivirga sp.]|nr:hypothetical protein [Fulvivirga sp.]